MSGAAPAPADVLAELGKLQARRGVQDPRRAAGPWLTRAFDLTGYRTDHARMRALVHGLLEHAEDLTPDLRLVFTTALAVRPQDPPSLTKRLERIAPTLHAGVRTVWRHLETANQRVAASITTKIQGDLAEAARDEWYLVRLTSDADLRQPRPVFQSEHVVRVVAPLGITTLTETISLEDADSDSDPEFAVSGDARLVRVERPFQSSWVLHLELHRTFACDELARYVVKAKVPSRRMVSPMSVMMPMRHCREFSTTVHFGTPPVAGQVWRLDGVPLPVAEADVPSGHVFDLAASPVATASHLSMERGRVYGLRWTWAENAP